MNNSAHASFWIEALDPEDPLPLMAAYETYWDEELEEWVVGDMLWEEDPPEEE